MLVFSALLTALISPLGSALALGLVALLLGQALLTIVLPTLEHNLLRTLL